MGTLNLAAPLVLFEKCRLWAGTGSHLLPSFHHHPTQHNYTTQTVTHTVTLTSASYSTLNRYSSHICGLPKRCVIRKYNTLNAIYPPCVEPEARIVQWVVIGTHTYRPMCSVPALAQLHPIKLPEPMASAATQPLRNLYSVLIFVTSYNRQGSPWNEKALSFLGYLSGCLQLPDRGVVSHLKKKQSRLRSAWLFIAQHSKPSRSARGTKRVNTK